MGSLSGAGIVYANYIHAIDLVEGGRHIRAVPGTASLFGMYAVRSSLMRQFTPLVAARFSQSGILLAAVHDFGFVVAQGGGSFPVSILWPSLSLFFSVPRDYCAAHRRLLCDQ